MKRLALLPVVGVLAVFPVVSVAQQADSQAVLRDTTVILEGALDAAPTIVRGARLIYPLDLLTNGRQGRVVVQFILDTTGRAERKTLRVISTPHMGFNVAAKGFVEDLEFTPALFQGRKVRALMQFPVDFRIAGRP